MKKLNIKLQNCHGIRDFQNVLNFRKGNSVAIYAPNGTMKTSFARTFSDLSRQVDSTDQMFPKRQTVREVTDEQGNDIDPRDIVVFLSYDEDLGPTEATSTLLVNADLRKEYEALQQELMSARDELTSALQTQAQTKQDVGTAVSRAFTKQRDKFFIALMRLTYEIAEQEDASLSDLPYDLFFNDKIVPVLRSGQVQSALSEYVEQLNELLDRSSFFSREAFNFYHAANVTKSLGDNGFFAAKHKIVLRGAEVEPVEVTSKADLEKIITSEKETISEDPALRKKLDAVEKAMNKNVDTRAFFAYISKHVELLPELADLDSFEQNLWKSYLKVHEGLYDRVVECYRSAEQRKKEIEELAASERTQWERVIDIFNDRFFVPFRLIATNRDRVVLGQEKLLTLGFEFEEGADTRPVERDELLSILSTGEKKALYILNVLFEVETRKSTDRPTVFVIDDIADSFDYKNKYAIIQYLKEMSEEPNFRLVLLTHNFDFFRTLQSRSVVGYDRCLMAQKNTSGVLLTPAVGVRNPFINDFKPNFFSDGMKRVAAIPFLRNIVEYTKGEEDSDYVKLTSLLHWKADTPTITQSEVDSIFNSTFGTSGSWASASQPVVDMIESQARSALVADEGVNFENKIALSIAIRIFSERHMVDMLADPAFTGEIQANQTQALFKAYKNRNLGTAGNAETLGSVVLMTPENLHVNSFMYEPIIDMSDAHLRRLFEAVMDLEGTNPPHKSSD